ncbi:integrase [Citrobacter sp. NCU1]|nr:integrase [Citrobacter sp. NCU1]
MIYKRNRYLIAEPSGLYLVRIALPDYMSAYFGGRKYFLKSTGTKDIREAQIFRDEIAVEFEKVREQLKPQPAGSRIERILNELKGIRTTAKDNPITLFSPVQTCPSLLKMRDLYLLQFKDKRKLTTLSKTNKAVEVLLEHLKKKDVQLRDVNRTVVTGWLDKLKGQRALQTIQNYISALAQIWDLARNRYHDAPQDNPWRGHGLEAKSSKVSYEVFTNIELAKVYALLNEEMQAVTAIGMYCGMRLNEICSLTTRNVKEIEGVLCFQITEGKTKSAARIVPVHSKVIPLVKSLLQNTHDDPTRE